ncbi:MAG: hypothetical protein WB615_02635 [Candidatus Tumulicola sp.]
MKYGLLACAVTLAAAMLFGCAGGGVAPSTAPLRGFAQHDQRTSAVRGALLYVSEMSGNDVAVYSYPDLQPQGKLTGLKRPEGLCVDKRSGSIWVVLGAFAHKIVEFAHGGTAPIRTLRSKSLSYAQSCAVDPVNGDISVVNNITGDDPGNVVVFQNGRGHGTVEVAPKMFYYGFVSYDDRGNAYLDGLGNGFILAKSRGGGAFHAVAVHGVKTRYAGGIEWTRSSLAVENPKHGIIYRLSRGTVTGTTTLQGTCEVEQFVIDGDRIVAPNDCGSNGGGSVGVYAYPAGGAPIAQLTGLRYPFAAAISR